MKTSLKLITLSFLFSITSCAFPAPSSGPAWLYTDVKETVLINNGVAIKKTGEACSSNILGFVSTGDTSVDLIKDKNGIKNVATIDRDFSGFLGIYAESCTIVSGN